ncbi:MAG: SPFH domain-containing protein, partial [Myxococcota bacterium]
DYEKEIILSVFRSASADVCSQFMAKDMHSGERSVIEQAIQKRMTDLLGERGFIIEAVLLKSIQLPRGLARSIEARLEAEQEAMRMEYVLEQEAMRMEFDLKQEKREAERKLIAAQGERDAQKVLSEGLTDEVLKLRAIEAFLKLASSPNTKVIITDTDATPLLPMSETK